MKRLDTYLAENGLVKSRERAKESILKGLVRVDGAVVTKASFAVPGGATVEYNPNGAMPFVGRGGLKLEKAIGDFGLDLRGKLVLDAGASTGGFTHCALLHGAAFVWAVDVGINQLDPTLRAHPGVCSLEQCDIRTLAESAIPQKVDLVVGDLSFISLTRVAPHLPKFLADHGAMVLLVKPQFEVGKELVGKSGIVRNAKAHVAAIERVARAFSEQGYHLGGLSNAPIHSRSKNIEYLALFSRLPQATPDVKQLVNFAFDFQKGLR